MSNHYIYSTPGPFEHVDSCVVCAAERSRYFHHLLPQPVEFCSMTYPWKDDDDTLPPISGFRQGKGIVPLREHAVLCQYFGPRDVKNSEIPVPASPQRAFKPQAHHNREYDPVTSVDTSFVDSPPSSRIDDCHHCVNSGKDMFPEVRRISQRFQRVIFGDSGHKEEAPSNNLLGQFSLNKSSARTLASGFQTPGKNPSPYEFRTACVSPISARDPKFLIERILPFEEPEGKAMDIYLDDGFVSTV
ncbi:hypothetical protein CROQUDRAFT_669764 [Cronartium quercuum f. sp. fusiforme G11]|uniref:Uncharacterized protein n=1 Tax=Cronartium quercuum f. sp. fusiforme G11 TaxID=708437 RepID=A0A9P6NR44_9BASI|nr:hypothetical protein CROQUDRAFT_669764 [Cronartium quercuum f. sp. fusiforme G11]